MIVKPFDAGSPPSDRMLRAGFEAEKQVAHYLHRAFAADPDILVLNNLRIVDAEQPEADGGPGVCQIDHLVVHRHGMFIVESKSITGEVRVRDDGRGGDEWSRSFGGRVQGMASPIRQGLRQGDFLRVYLQRNRERVLGKVEGLRGVMTKAFMGTDQRGFKFMPIQVFIAISDGAVIERLNGWKEPATRFLTWAGKADLATEIIRKEIERHRVAFPLTSVVFRGEDGEYGYWGLVDDSPMRVAEFLRASDTPRDGGRTERVPRTPPPAPAPPLPPLPRARAVVSAAPVVHAPNAGAPDGNLCDAACKGCRGRSLAAQWGKFGYYWKCVDCGVNTAMPAVCSLCGERGARGDGVKIRKEGVRYFRRCVGCGVEECIWIEGVR